LNTERAEVGQVIQSVRKLQSEFDKAVLRVKDDEKGNLKKLAKLYGTMSPDIAANVLEQLDNEAIVKIMLFLKNEETAAILEAMPRRAKPSPPHCPNLRADSTFLPLYQRPNDRSNSRPQSQRRLRAAGFLFQRSPSPQPALAKKIFWP
jgi:hypothetical protein